MHDQNYERKISVLDWGIVISARVLVRSNTDSLPAPINLGRRSNIPKGGQT